MTGNTPFVRSRAVLKLCSSNLSLYILVAFKTQFGFRTAKQAAELVVMRSVALDAGQFLCHGVVLEFARSDGFPDILVAFVEAQYGRGPGQQRRIVGIVGTVTLGTVFICQMTFLLFSRNCNRTHFLVALLKTKLASRGIQHVFVFGCVRTVAAEALAAAGRRVGEFLGKHRLLIVTFIAQFRFRAFADMLWLLRTVRVVAPQALSFGDGIVQYVSGGINALVACQTQLFFGFRKLEFVIAAR